jgi:ABC-2 type transport system ATP-binding protein
MTAMLSVNGLTRRFGGLVAVNDLSFDVNEGDIIGLIGPNGSGKTTLFECLGGVLPIDDGTIQQGARPLTSRERAGLLFYLPDAIAPWPAQRVGWLLDYIAGLFVGSLDRRPEIVRELGLEPLLAAPLGSLSKGQRKRALLAMGLLTPQPVLLSDEPFDGLDLRQSRDVARLLRDSTAGGRAIVLSIHQIGDAARVCDRFVLLSNGRVCGEGTQEELTAMAEARSGERPAGLDEVFLALT